MLRKHGMHDRSLPLVALGRALAETGYEFVTVTPATHGRVVARRGGMDALGTTLRDVFGWSLPFEAGLLPPAWLEWLERAGALAADVGRFRSRVRFSTLAGRLFAHSAAPTTAPDSVFFGPDTYRFAAFLERYAPRAERLVDIGCGSGAGGLVLSKRVGSVVLGDVNPRALELAHVNAALSANEVELVQSDVLASVTGPVDLAIANPPYLRDDLQRQYRDGGGAHGEALGLRIVREALGRLQAGGTLLLYTGAPIVAGRDYFLEHVTLCLHDRVVRTSPGPKAVAVLRKSWVEYRLQDLHQGLLDESVEHGRDAKLSHLTVPLRNQLLLHRRGPVRPREQLLAELGPVGSQVVRQLFHRHPIDAGTTLVLPHSLQRGLKVLAFAQKRHQSARSRALVSLRPRGRFLAPLYPRGFTPTLQR